jgi:hypothetical protein
MRISRGGSAYQQGDVKVFVVDRFTLQLWDAAPLIVHSVRAVDIVGRVIKYR